MNYIEFSIDSNLNKQEMYILSLALLQLKEVPLPAAVTIIFPNGEEVINIK